MRVPFGWLTSLCDPGLDPEALAERLSMTGTEVERLERLGVVSADGFVVGGVLAVEAHPNADRLSVCRVDVGEPEPRTIVCGAPNVAAGQTVAVALPGAVMPDGTELGEAKLRGVASSGMILSETEMEIGDDASGIAVLERAEPGTPLAEVLPIAETVLDLEITPNRPDCLGVHGVAREVHAATGAELAPDPWSADAEPSGDDDVSDHASVRVDVPDLCPRFTARAFEGVTIGPSPPWLKARLLAAGQRPINNVVDITNYVMLLTGQPLHAFDLDRVPGGEIVVRAAAEGERMTTLDGVERTLDAETVLVCDRERPSGIAGIMGGQVSEVSDETTRVLLEAANWNGPNILRTSNLLGLRSEASTRFEKGLHPDLTLRGQAVASRLLVELCGARLVPGTIDVDAGGFEPRRVAVRPARAEALLGMEVPEADAIGHLERLGLVVERGEGELVATIPADRWFDLTREVDLIEEIGRIHGLDEHLPITLPERGAGPGGLGREGRLRRAVEDALAGAGVDEAVTWSFDSPGRPSRLGLDEAESRSILLSNPMSAEGAAMRTELIGGLLDVVARNAARGAERVAVFESGRAYLPERPPAGDNVLAGSFAGERPSPAWEPHRIGCALSGPLRDPSWREQPAPADFYDAKGLLEHACAAVGVAVAAEPAARPFLHPARSAAVILGGEEIGWIGEIHPRLAAALDLPGDRPVAAFEIDLGPVLAASSAGRETYEDVTSFPAVAEDIAVVAPTERSASRIAAVVAEAGGELLREVCVFDVYEGEQVPEGHRSLALRLTFAAPDRTLTDEEVAERRAAIVEALSELGAQLRG